MNDDDRFDNWLRAAAEDYNAPPAVPREEMWQAIEARRRSTIRPGGRGRTFTWMAWAAGIAAVLATGVVIGRLSNVPELPVPVAEAPANETGAAYRLAATEYLSRTEVFLTDFRQEAGSGPAENSTAEIARALLTDSRLLLDSPAANDARLRTLLEDLELVLAEIAQLAGETRPGERSLITDGMDEGGLMLRLRTAVPAGSPLVGT
ncbi:MAG: hypothetical protein ACREL6_09865 [Gemmatimonadales bacterium]